ncbi:hypothetical protein P7K49_025039 [Saguinus oedipus]|uniref:Uncharacterized protein n=1 Tax=Saguinus oedipus TaxID=9490 RepID=A0ABQ9UG40_SAGOE|nr:hypothetical protein P7K49_025039 [Saguinus oedipus]
MRGFGMSVLRTLPDLGYRTASAELPIAEQNRNLELSCKQDPAETPRQTTTASSSSSSGLLAATNVNTEDYSACQNYGRDSLCHCEERYSLSESRGELEAAQRPEIPPQGPQQAQQSSGQTLLWGAAVRISSIPSQACQGSSPGSSNCPGLLDVSPQDTARSQSHLSVEGGKAGSRKLFQDRPEVPQGHSAGSVGAVGQHRPRGLEEAPVLLAGLAPSLASAPPL